jgi:zona occludens toxin (predicted ATPase)
LTKNIEIMKKSKKIALLFAVITLTISCDELHQVASSSGVGTTSGKPQLTNDEVIAGLKEALTVGIKNSVSISSATDGFWKNDLIRLPFPEDAIKVREKALEWEIRQSSRKI